MSQQSVYLKLKVGGNDVAGESTVHNMGGEDVQNAIECVGFEQLLSVGYDPRVSRPTAPPAFGPVRIRKEIDKSTPVMAQALTATSPAEAVFHFFRQSSSGSGTKEFYRVKLENARIARMESNVLEREGDELPREVVDFVFSKISWTYITEDGDTTEHSWDWAQQPNS
ncbi:Hcp family type VI secretion system effector [Sandaracinus amylolyticus]|uniref:Putative cytoplasmic protein USSDB7A n=1 Tax=Sandaracinus amylolyticus TaxID=927083 RepID=A0A0F6YKV1_9BACT|nr:type VI secretion system tube protein Hcp [Sandaracinus amylolyticus]AKF08810.1 Putative cytoplasmic protein USSDB7A [Sandaracinus amylolyticus]UJR78614.1 Putative cytoplasmic protein USSDB7A [Sandaracinus amylolyticus]